MKRVFASFVLLLFTAYTLQAQTTWFVMPGAPTTGSGNAWANPIDLQTAISTASSGDSVFVAQGTYQPASGVSFSMKEGVKIYGGFQGTETSLAQRNLSAGYTSTLKGNNARVVYNLNSGLTAAAILDGFTIANGNASYGGGIMNNNTSPTISNCVITGNNGGGIWNAFSAASFIKCVITGNIGGSVAAYAGGIGCASANNVSIINCIISGNTGFWGGGIYIDDLGPNSPRIINCTIWGNTASSSTGAGAVYCNSRSVPQIQNCIIWANNSGIKTQITATLPVITNNIIQGGYSGNFNVDPLLVNPANPAGPDNIWGTADDGFMLQTGSPALNTGTADITGLNLPNTDIAGAARVQGGKIDIGAYESSFTCPGFTTLYVDSSVAASGDGSSWATAFKTLDEGLMGANQCTVVSSVLVAKGTYQPAGTSFNLLPHVAIYGGFPSGGGSFAQRNTLINASILKGNGSNVIYNYLIDATALLDGFTITGGSAQFGGGMYNYFSSPVINNCIFSGNSSSSNGSGGAIYNINSSSPFISNCVFSGNIAYTTTNGGGGAMLNSNASPAIVNCIFYNNTAAYGGAIFNNTATNSIIRNSVFVGNTSFNDAAAIANYGNALTITNSTFANNNAGGGGGAIDNYGAALTVTNGVFWGNTASDANKDIWFETGSLNMTYSFSQLSWTGTGNIQGSSNPFSNDANPIGADGVWGTNDDGLTLKAGSPCLNAGTPDTTGLSLGNTDIAGNLRIIGSAIDMGAYEYDNSVLPITLISFTGNLQKSVAELQWQTGIESNFNHFEVEKSTDASVFRSQGSLSAKGNGSNYSFPVPQQELTAYYRLKIVDNDGGFTYSRVLRLSQTADNDVLVYPNPVINQVNIKVAAAGSLSIYSADGKLVKIQTIMAGWNRVDVSGLSAGLYYGVINGINVKFIKK